ncbi:MAG TPA: peptidoglycan DD-metalloendopeptidase family protein [Candidatus Nitrosotalea sp.]|jgi:septal ring factor EnvC (AmiA/AmiB activator)|nr:peptidoglycan DD-metalloendopeptidase family protein [Candidatus Nitrosotalea sp.]
MRARALGLALVIAPALLAPASALAQAKREGAADIGDKQRDLQQTQKRLKEERQKAADARKREASVLSELEAIDHRLTDKRKQVATIDGRMRRAQSDVAELQGEIGRLQARRSGQEEVLGRRLRALYKLQAQGGVLPIVLSGDDPVAQAVQLRHLTTLATVDARLIREYRVTSEVMADRKSRLEARGRELASLRSEAEQERTEFDQEAAKRRALLGRVQDERAYHDRMVGELSEATRRLEAFIRDLQEKQRRAVAKVPPPSRPSRPTPGDSPGVSGTGFASLRGRLSWPADGRVVGEYGPQVNPRFGTKTFRNGIDIEANEGSNIAAVFPGHVVYTGWFRGYGNLIIVDHGGEYYTVYAHAADIRVTEGDEVKQGQIIGTVGDTGSLQGPRLYFEVRHEGKPQDPAQWLRPKG